MKDYEIIHALMKVKGALDYSGDASVQVVLPLADGGHIRIGVTDDDVGAPGIWIDNYEGFNGELKGIYKNE